MSSASAGQPDAGSYTAAMRMLHWLTAALLVGSYTSAWATSSATDSAGVSRLTLLHRSFGLAVLTLTALRLVWRQRTRLPALPFDMPWVQRLAARANVVGLYVLLVSQPLLGLTASMLHGDRLVLLDEIGLPNMLPRDRRLAHVLFEIHGTVAVLLLGLIGLHAAAAIFHHFVLRDGVLAGMVPILKRRDNAGRQLPSAR